MHGACRCRHGPVAARPAYSLPRRDGGALGNPLDRRGVAGLAAGARLVGRRRRRIRRLSLHQLHVLANAVCRPPPFLATDPAPRRPAGAIAIVGPAKARPHVADKDVLSGRVGVAGPRRLHRARAGLPVVGDDAAGLAGTGACAERHGPSRVAMVAGAGAVVENDGVPGAVPRQAACRGGQRLSPSAQSTPRRPFKAWV